MVDWGIIGAAICRVNEEIQVERQRGRWSGTRICCKFVSVIQLQSQALLEVKFRVNELFFWRTEVDRLHNYFEKHLKFEESQMNAWSS
jgi:hypothetical protein